MRTNTQGRRRDDNEKVGIPIVIAIGLALALAALTGCGGLGGSGSAASPMSDAGTSGGDTSGGGGYAGGADVTAPADTAAPPADSSGGWWPGADAPLAPDVSEPWNGSFTCDPACGPGQTCQDGWCVSGGCVPACDGRQCGPDGCGGSCGWCSGSASCQAGTCIDVPDCTPECGGQMVGADDGCGGVCTGGGFGIGLKPGGAQDVGCFRRLIADGQVPDPEMFPIEGFLNEHDTPLPPPDFEHFVTLHAFLGLFFDSEEEAPLLAMQLGMNSGIDPAVIEAKHFNLVVVVDTSGSMGQDNKMDFVREGLLLMLDSLDDNDTLSIVTYDDVARVAMAPVQVTEELLPNIRREIEDLMPGGSTNLNAGMVLGYETAMRNITDSEAIHRILLLSDGNITAGEDNLERILDNSAQYIAEGIGITTIGVGLDFNQELMYHLANQGNGNFYFLDDGDKLVEVFQHELEYLMTPVAENLKISFQLPDGFFVEEIYGFEFREDVSGDWVLLGPSAQYTVDGGSVEPGPDPDPGPGPGPDDVSISTLFASGKNGLLMVKLGADRWDIFDAWDAMDFATISYSYDLVSKGTTESNEKVVTLGSLSYFAADDTTSGRGYFTGPIMQRNYCVLRAGLALREACELFHQDPPAIDRAVMELADATTFCTGANLHLSAPDPEIAQDIALMDALRTNMCEELECMLP